MWWKLSFIDWLCAYIGLTHDPRTDHLLLINVSPVLVFWGCFNFIMLAKVLGPELMKNSEPLNVKFFLLLYNALMASFNLYAVICVVPLSNYFGCLWNFEYPDRSDMSEEAITTIHLGYLYWLTKLGDCFDTFFFLARKKYEHLTLLHVYHHTVVPIFGYILMKTSPLIPAAYLFAIVNSTIHVIMYSYYLLSALGPKMRKYLWWKKYITVLQLWQFVLYGMYGGAMCIFQTNYPTYWIYFGLTQPPLFFWLFYDFYIKAYQTKQRQQKQQQQNKLSFSMANNNNQQILSSNHKTVNQKFD